jgi:hypothetical protein
VRPIWTRLDNAKLCILTDITPIEKIVVTEEYDEKDSQENEFSNFPNPSGEISYISFKLKKNTLVSLEIKNIHGQFIKSIINNEIRPYGTYVEPIDLKNLHLQDGTYLIKLSLDGKIKTERQVIVK